MKESINSVNELSNLKPHNFVLYYSNGCGHCHNFEDQWGHVVNKINMSNLNLKPISIESEHFGDLEDKNIYNKVSGVPTMALLDETGGFVKKYDGSRESDPIMSWLKDNVPVIKKKVNTRHKHNRKPFLKRRPRTRKSRTRMRKYMNKGKAKSRMKRKQHSRKKKTRQKKEKFIILE